MNSTPVFVTIIIPSFNQNVWYPTKFFFLFHLFLHVVDLPWIYLNGQILDDESLSIRLNLVNIGSEIRKPSLIIDTNCIWTLGTSREHFFMVFTGRDDNKLQIYKITKSFFLFVWGVGVKVVVVVVGCWI